MVVTRIKNLLKDIQLLFNGQYLSLEKTISINCEWYGNDYGGFYIHPNNLNANSIIYSFGIGEDISFDTQVIKKHNCFVYGFDPTPKSINWIKNQNLPNNFLFFDCGIDNKTGVKKFFLPKNTEHVSGSIMKVNTINTNHSINVNMKSFNDITEEFNHKIIDVLKMDIEGSEYEVLSGILNSNIIIKQILIEFHHRMIKKGAKLTVGSIELLESHGFKLFAYSKRKEELSFINTKYNS